MNLAADDLRYLADCALRAAEEAGRLVAKSGPTAIEYKSGTSDASRIVTDVDRRAEEQILETLAPTIARFELGLLSEERGDDGSRLRSEHFWCIDPLDGTLPFTEGKPGYAVSIALVSKDGRPDIGVIVDPVRKKTYCAIRNLGIQSNGKPWSPASREHGNALSVFIDRSMQARADYPLVLKTLEQIAESMGLGATRIHVGSGAVVNACQVLDNAPACYFKFPKAASGGGSLWDFAATTCLFAEAGAIATDMMGSRLDLNREDSTFMNHRGVVFSTDEEVARRVRALHSL